jgi:hypothetical protein
MFAAHLRVAITQTRQRTSAGRSSDVRFNPPASCWGSRGDDDSNTDEDSRIAISGCLVIPVSRHQFQALKAVMVNVWPRIEVSWAGGLSRTIDLVNLSHFYSTETLVRQKANVFSVVAVPDTCTSTLLNSVLDVANAPLLSQHVVLNWPIGMGTPLSNRPP